MKTKFYKNVTFWLWFIFGFTGLIYFSTVILNHYLFKTHAYDYANYNFAFWDYAHFRLSRIPTLTFVNMTFLQDHFSFTLMYLVPFYWLLNWLTGTYTLLILQVAFILYSGYYVYKLVGFKTGNNWLGIGALISYFIIQGRWSSFTSDCNIAIFTSCMVPFFLYFFEKKRFWLASIIFVLALFSRENMAIWFIFISVVLIIWHRKERKEILISGGYILASLIFFILLFKVFIPALETTEKTYSLFNFKALGNTPSDALIFILTHPLHTLKLLFVNHLPDPSFRNVKFEFYYVYLISGGFLLFYRPYYFIWFIPIIAQKMFNDLPDRWGIELYYSIEVVTLLPITIFLIIGELKSMKLKNYLAITVCVLTLLMTLVKFNYRNREMGWWKANKEAVFCEGFFKTNLDIKKTYRILDQIPPDAKICSSAKYITHLSQRQYCYMFPWVNDAEYMIVSLSSDFWLVPDEEYKTKLKPYLNNPSWKKIDGDQNLVLLKKIK